MKTRFAITNGLFASLLPEPSVAEGDLVVEGGRIVAFGPGEAARVDAAVDAKGALVLPGMVNAHTHLYSALAVGMPAPAVAPTNFVEILERIWWRLDRALDPETLHLSGLIGGLEAARSGVTVVFDHHASPSWIEGSLGILARALDTVGLRGVLCYEVTDRGGPELALAGIEENVGFTEHWETRADRRFRGLIGGHASLTLSDATLEALGTACDQTGRGFHIHVAEDRADLDAGDPVARYAAHGLLGPSTLIAHGVHLDDAALATLAEHGCWLAHNPRSNMNNAVGYAQRVASYPRVAIGTDGIGSDVLCEARTAFLKARDAGVDDAWGLPMRLLQGGLTLAEQHLGVPMGRFEPGAAADVVLTDYVPPTPLHAYNLAGHLLFGFDRSHIKAVWAHGRQVWPTTLDLQPLYARSRAAAQALWERMGELDG